MISQSSLDTLKSRIDIVDTIGNYLELKKAGANYKAPCPFHDEKSASFTVSPKKQIYHCFGCGVSGDAIKFVQEYKRLSFSEAAEEIANDINVTLTYDNATENKKDYTKLMESTNRYYLSRRNTDHVTYLMERGVGMQSIEDFEIGFAPASSDTLGFLSSNAFLLPDAIECGICANDSGRTYARLTERITFPIRNHTGKLIGFGGRTTTNHPAKYVNSPQTRMFDKSRNLYGYNLAKPHIHQKGTFTITEGYLDVVMFHQAGIKTAVATMGTALTEEHCKLIKKSGAKALLCYDGDKAGIAAAFKASKLLSSHGIYGGVVIFPEGKDPADMVRDGDISGLIALLKRPTPLIKFALNQIASGYNLSLPHEKESALREITEFTHTLTPLIQDEYQPYVANLLGINTKHVTIKTPEPIPIAKLPDINVSELNIIKAAYESDAIFSYLCDTLDRSFFTVHANEFDMLMNGDERLAGILLHDDLGTFSDDDILRHVRIMEIEHYQRLSKGILASEGSYGDKISRLKEINDKIAVNLELLKTM